MGIHITFKRPASMTPWLSLQCRCAAMPRGVVIRSGWGLSAQIKVCSTTPPAHTFAVAGSTRWRPIFIRQVVPSQTWMRRQK